MNDKQLLEKLRTPRKIARLVVAPSWKAGKFGSLHQEGRAKNG